MMQLTKSNDNLFNVYDNQTTYMVDLKNRTCTCKKFQIEEIPCCHVVAIIKHLHQDCYQYCSHYHEKETMLATYKETVYPIPSQDSWEIPQEIKEITVLQPHGKRQPGRPQKRRKKGKSEYTKRHKCSICRETGHKRSSCKNIPSGSHSM